MYQLPKEINQELFLKALKKICLKASSLLKSYNQNVKSQEEFQEKLRIEYKDNSPVTDADLKVNQLIIDGIKDEFPDQNWIFLSEETYKGIDQKELKNDWIWIIDPLDGTKDFIKKTGEYAIHLALTFRKVPTFSVVVVPDLEEYWFYLEGIGTWCESTFKDRKIMSGHVEKEFEDLTILTSKSHKHEKLVLLLEKLNVSKVIGMGSVGNKITKIIKEEADLYISYSLKGKSSPKDWDMAAPEALLRGAGGYMTDVNGNNLRFLEHHNLSQGGIIVGSKNKNHKEFCQIISKSIVD